MELFSKAVFPKMLSQQVPNYINTCLTKTFPHFKRMLSGPTVLLFFVTLIAFSTSKRLEVFVFLLVYSYSYIIIYILKLLRQKADGRWPSFSAWYSH